MESKKTTFQVGGVFKKIGLHQPLGTWFVALCYALLVITQSTARYTTKYLIDIIKEYGSPDFNLAFLRSYSTTILSIEFDVLNVGILLALGAGAVFLWNRYKRWSIDYKGSPLGLFLCPFIGSALIFVLLLLKNATLNLPQESVNPISGNTEPNPPLTIHMSFSYQGTWGWMFFWSLFAWPVCFFLFLLNGFQITKENHGTTSEESGKNELAPLDKDLP